MSSSKCPVFPTRVESLVWTKSERNWLDKMWLDSGVGGFDCGVGEFDSGLGELYLSSNFGS